MKIEIKESVAPKVFALLYSLGYVVWGVISLRLSWGAHEVMTAWMGWALVIIGGISLPWDVLKLCDNRPLLLIDDRGIYDRLLGVGLIPWSDIRNAFLQSDHLNYRICLDVVNAESYLDRLSPRLRLQRRLKFDPKGMPLYVNLFGRSLMPKPVLKLIRERFRSSW
jgi:hypothetical protein